MATMRESHTREGELRVHFAGTKTRSVLFGLDWTSLSVLCAAGASAVGAWVIVRGTLGIAVAVVLVLGGGLASSRWERVVHRGASLLKLSTSEVRGDRRRHARKRHRTVRLRETSLELGKSSSSRSSQRQQRAPASRGRRSERSRHLVDGEFIYHAHHVLVHDHANGKLRVGFRLPDTQPWLQESEELDLAVSAWSDLLAVIARQLPASIGLSWRVDVVPTLESWERIVPSSDSRGLGENGDAVNSALQREIAQRAWSVQSTLWLDRSGVEREGRAARERTSLTVSARICETSFRSRGLGELVPLSEAELHHLLTPTGLSRIGPRERGAVVLRDSDLAVEWDEMRIGDGYATSLVVESWPEHSVSSGFALDLFRPCPPRRSITLTLKSLAADQALRRTRRYRTEHLANTKMRNEAGYLERVIDSRASSSMVRQERELTSGHTLFDYQLGVVLFAGSRLTLTRSLQQFGALADSSQTRFVKAYGRQYEIFGQLFGLQHGKMPRRRGLR